MAATAVIVIFAVAPTTPTSLDDGDTDDNDVMAVYICSRCSGVLTMHFAVYK